MNRIARLIGLSTALLLVFLVAVLVTQHWLRTHTDRLAIEIVETRQKQLAEILQLAKPGPLPWSEGFVSSLRQALDAQIVVTSSSAPSAAKPAERTAADAWTFSHTVSDPSGQPAAKIDVTLEPPPVVRLVNIYRQTAIALLILAFGLMLLLATIILFSSQPHSRNGNSTEKGVVSARGEIDSLTHLAKVSVRQGAELERERLERLRAEEDLHFQQVLLNRALEEKIRLGRDLHDGIIQSLYATGLTVEAAKNTLAARPADAQKQLEQSLETLNATIRDVRSYIAGLAPESLRRQTFAESVHSLTQTLDGARAVSYDLRIDDQPAARLSENEYTDLLQIVREAVSNSLRHGGASQMVIRLHEDGGNLCLLVQDNGRGFDAESISRGHGLSNMRSRAERLGATLRCTSGPGQGTRIVLTMPATRPLPT